MEIIERKEQFLKQSIPPKIYYEDLENAKNKFDIVAEYLGKSNVTMFAQEIIPDPTPKKSVDHL